MTTIMVLGLVTIFLCSSLAIVVAESKNSRAWVSACMIVMVVGIITVGTGLYQSGSADGPSAEQYTLDVGRVYRTVTSMEYEAGKYAAYVEEVSGYAQNDRWFVLFNTEPPPLFQVRLSGERRIYVHLHEQAP